MNNEKRHNWNDYVEQATAGFHERLNRRKEILARLCEIRSEMSSDGRMETYDRLQKERQLLTAELATI